MKASWKLAGLIGALTLAAVIGCDSSLTSTGIGRSGIDRNGIALGPVSNFGSIVVNGVRYDTANATFMNDGIATIESDLKVGDVVLVQGTIDDNLTTGTADSVTFDDNVTGPVESVNLALSQLVVVGQLIIAGPETSFDDGISPASLEGLFAGDIVEISGYFTANGDIEATRIETKPAGTQFEVHGTVSDLNSANFMFSINGLAVDYTNATLTGFPGGQLSDGDFVEAKGANLGAAGELIATSVEFENVGITGDDGDHVEIEGFITRFGSDQDFDVAGTPVITDAGTIFEGGVAADLGLNIKVEVEGDFNANGVIVADKVDIRRSTAVRAEALIDSVDAGGNSLIMLSITFNVDELTRFEDKSGADVDPLTIADLNAGDYLAIRGVEFPAGSGDILATILEREDADPETILQGFIETISDPSLTILGVTIETNGATIFRDTDDNILTATEFFNLAVAGSLIKAKGVESSATTITASEVEFELEI